MQKCDFSLDIELVNCVSYVYFTARKVKKVWRDRQTLKVYFMNPDDIDDWRCRGEPMNINTIFAWARVWNIAPYPEIPKFEMIERASRADIRVKFSSNRTFSYCKYKVFIIFFIDTGDNWSMVGIEATQITDLRKPTMQLNLGGHTPELQESLVIHQFGHALGLGHEHQRSDFWEIVGRHLDIEQMKMDPIVNPSRTPEDGERMFQKDWGENNGDQSVNSLSEYDPDSIMHHR